VRGLVSIVGACNLPNRVAQLLTDFPLQEAFGPDGPVVALTARLALLAGGIAGLSPAIESLRIGVAYSLRDGGRMGSGQGSNHAFRQSSSPTSYRFVSLCSLSSP
jgi:hypothetical protein